MNPRQRKFADNYILTGNAYQSAIDAGYTHNYADRNSKYLLGIVGDYLDKNMAKLSNSKIATAEEVLEYLTAVVRGDIKEQEAIYNPKTTQVEVKNIDPAIRDRTKAAELLGKRHRLFTDTLEIDLTVTKPLEEWLDE